MFEFLWPLCFVLLPLPWLYRHLLPPAGTRAAALQVSFLARLEALQSAAPQGGAPGRKWPFVALWILLVCAAARPVWLGDPLPTATTGRDMMLALDLSGSMEFRDMSLDGEETDRLTLVKHVIGEFIDRRHGDRLGLILFGSQAYVQAPLTHDRHSIHEWVDESFIGLPGRETAIGNAIGLAVKRLMDEPAPSRVLLLITDGANTAGNISPLQAAELAAARQVRIFTIGIGGDSQAADNPSSSLWGLQYDPSIELDEGSLREIAHITGGEFFRARNEEDLTAIYHRLDQLEPALREGLPDRQATALYPWPLGLALLFSLGLSSATVIRSRQHV